jgi:DNA end-binding protein Ku
VEEEKDDRLLSQKEVVCVTEPIMRAQWSGFLSFGLVSIPVKMYRAAKERSISFDFLHKKDLSPIRYAKICTKDGKELTQDQIVRGYEVKNGEYVILTPADFEKANMRKTKLLEIDHFTELEGVDALYYESPHYLLPSPEGERAYALLREALHRSNTVGVARFAFRGKGHLCVIAPKDKTLLVHQLRYHEELTLPDPSAFPDARVQNNEMALALALIEQMRGPFRPERYRDTYTRELMGVIRQKLEGKRVKAREKAPEPTELKDLLPLLRASLEKAPRRSTKKPQEPDLFQDLLESESDWEEITKKA